ncbi:MAG: hypothetical protein AB1410_03565 [Acidobacteriota bacterium]
MKKIIFIGFIILIFNLPIVSDDEISPTVYAEKVPTKKPKFDFLSIAYSQETPLGFKKLIEEEKEKEKAKENLKWVLRANRKNILDKKKESFFGSKEKFKKNYLPEVFNTRIRMIVSPYYVSGIGNFHNSESEKISNFIFSGKRGENISWSINSQIYSSTHYIFRLSGGVSLKNFNGHNLDFILGYKGKSLTGLNQRNLLSDFTGSLLLAENWAFNSNLNLIVRLKYDYNEYFSIHSNFLSPDVYISWEFLPKWRFLGGFSIDWNFPGEEIFNNENLIFDEFSKEFIFHGYEPENVLRYSLNLEREIGSNGLITFLFYYENVNNPLLKFPVERANNVFLPEVSYLILNQSNNEEKGFNVSFYKEINPFIKSNISYKLMDTISLIDAKKFSIEDVYAGKAFQRSYVSILSSFIEARIPFINTIFNVDYKWMSSVPVRGLLIYPYYKSRISLTQGIPYLNFGGHWTVFLDLRNITENLRFSLGKNDYDEIWVIIPFPIKILGGIEFNF